MKYSYMYRKYGAILDIYANKIKPLFDNTGLSDSELEKAIGLPRSIIYNWNKGINKSYKKYIPEIANYFQLSMDYFSDNEQNNKLDAISAELGPKGKVIWEKLKQIRLISEDDYNLAIAQLDLIINHSKRKDN